MWMAIVTLLIILAAVYFIVSNRNRPATGGKSRHNIIADIPTRVLKPASYRNVPLIVAWEFVAPNLSKSCNFARDNAGVRKDSGSCTPLPLAECGSESCLCHYRPIFDERKRSRRKEHDRRTEYRMDDKEERRAGADRRSDNHSWNDRHIK